MKNTIDPVVSRLIARLTQIGMSHGNIAREIAHETGCNLESAIALHSHWLAGLASRMEQITPEQPLAVGDIVTRPDTVATLFAAVVHIDDTGYITLKAGRSYWTLTQPLRLRYRPLPPAPQTSEAWVTTQKGRDGVWDLIGEAPDVETALHLMGKAVKPYESVAIMSGQLWRAGVREPVMLQSADFQIAVKLG